MAGKKNNAQTGKKRPWGTKPWQRQKPGNKKGVKLGPRVWTPEDGSPIGKPIGPDRARELNRLRRSRPAGPGRPRSDRLRCFCGAMTLHRAIKRGHNCEEPSLSEGI